MLRPGLALIVGLSALAFPAAAPADDSTVPPGASFRAEFLAQLDDVEKKLLSLAEAIPQEKYGWRPGEGVRSTSEVFLHIAGGNYFLATFLGADAPKNDYDLEKIVTRKADVIVELKKSFDHLHAAASRTTELEKPVKMFGTSTTNRGVLVTVLSHLHEHLGQSIAYARMNGVTPPWSR